MAFNEPSYSIVNNAHSISFASHSRSIYFSLFEIPIAVTLYILSTMAKIMLLFNAAQNGEFWRDLVFINILELIAWAFWILKRHGNKMGPVLLLMPFACAVYTNAPIALLSAGLNIYPFQGHVVRQGMWMQSLFSTNLWFFIGILFSQSKSRQIGKEINLWIRSVEGTLWGIRIFILTGLILSSAYAVNFYLSGAASAVGTVSRPELLKMAETGKTWLITSLFERWAMVCLIAWNSFRIRSIITKAHIVLSIIAILIFMDAYVRLGNRLNLLEYLIFFFVILCLKGRIKIVLIAVSFIIPPLIYFSLARSFGLRSVASLDPVDLYTTLFAEFIYPHFPLLYHIASGHSLWLGWSYFRLPGFILPSFGAWTKSPDLATIFALKYADNGMGFAYTPLGEGFANFGYISIVLVPLLIAAALRFLTSWRIGFPIVFLLFLSFTLDINRGESIEIEADLLFGTLILLFFLRIIRLQISHRSQSAINSR